MTDHKLSCDRKPEGCACSRALTPITPPVTVTDDDLRRLRLRRERETTYTLKPRP